MSDEATDLPGEVEATTPLATIIKFPPKAEASVGTSLDLTALKPGDKGDNVTLLQNVLASWGFPAGAADGIYGANTASAVTALQRKLGITPSGNFDDATKKAALQDLQSDTSVIRANQNATGLVTSTALPSTALVTPGAAAKMQDSPLAALFANPWVLGGLGLLLVGGWYWSRKSAPYTELAGDDDEPADEEDDGGEDGGEDGEDAAQGDDEDEGGEGE